MKKLLSFVLIFAMTVSFLPSNVITAFASENEYNGFTYSESNGVITILGCDKTMTVAVVPDEIDGLPVTTIGEYAFNDSNIEYLYIPDSVTELGKGFCSYAQNLKRVRLSENITKIPAYAFSDGSGRGNFSVEKIDIPNGVTEIGDYAFATLFSIKELRFPNGVTKIGDSAFYACEALQTLYLPKSVESIGEYNFYKLFAIKNLYYGGSEADYKNLTWGVRNDESVPTNIIYNYGEPVLITASAGGALPGEQVSAKVTLPANSGVCGGSFNLVYDNTKLQVISATAGSVISDRMSTVNPNYAENKVKITFAGTSAIVNKGDILNITFEISDNATGIAEIGIESLKLSDYDVNLINSAAIGGQVLIRHIHDWGIWNITSVPTEKYSGTARRVCNDDSNHVEYKTLPKLTDTSVWTKGEYNAPNCTTEGRQIYNSIYGDVTIKIPANDNHAWGEWNITKESTQT